MQQCIYIYIYCAVNNCTACSNRRWPTNREIVQPCISCLVLSLHMFTAPCTASFLLVLLVSVSAATSAIVVVVVVPFLTRSLSTFYTYCTMQKPILKGGNDETAAAAADREDHQFYLKKKKEIKGSLRLILLLFVERSSLGTRREPTSFLHNHRHHTCMSFFASPFPVFLQKAILYLQLLTCTAAPAAIQMISVYSNYKKKYYSRVEAVSSWFAIF